MTPEDVTVTMQPMYENIAFFGAWLFAGVCFVWAWSLFCDLRKLFEDRPLIPNQWKRYRGIMNLPARKGEPPPINTAELVQALKKLEKK